MQRWLKFVKYLPEFKIHPTVITVDENYAAYPKIDNSFEQDTRGVEVHKTKATDYYKFYTAFKKENKIPQGGVPNGKSGWKNRLSLALRNHLFVPDPRIGWNKHAFTKACELIEKGDIDIVVTTSPPHSTQLIGLKLKKKFPKLTWVADLRDPWTDIYYYKDLGHSKISDLANKNKEIAVLENADKVIVVSPHMKLLFSGKSEKVASEKISVIPNGFDHSEFQTLPEKTNTVLNITYVGTANKDYDISAFLEALKILKAQGIQFTWNIIGEFSEEVKNVVEQSGLSNSVKYHGYLPHNEAIEHTKSADLLLLIIPKVVNNKLIYSGKLFEYIATKNPILCLGPHDGDAATLINKYDLGQNFLYNDNQGITEYLQTANKQFEANSLAVKEFDSNQFSRKELTRSLVELLNKEKN